MTSHGDSFAGIATPPVDNDETLVRQIKPGTNPLFFDESRHPLPVLHWSLFRPAPGDQDGLSLIRLRFRSEAWAAFRPMTPDHRFRLARLLPAKLVECGRASGLEWLHFQPSADDLDDEHGQPWAHCVVGEINAIAYNDKTDPESKKRILTWAERVANQVSRDDITGPYDRPVPGVDPYRPVHG
jgi:hypothetical protein